MTIHVHVSPVFMSTVVNRNKKLPAGILVVQTSVALIFTVQSFATKIVLSRLLDLF